MQFHRQRTKTIATPKNAPGELKQFFHACLDGQHPPKGVRFCELRNYYGLDDWILRLGNERYFGPIGNDFVALDVIDLDRLEKANTDGLTVTEIEQTYKFSFANRRAKIIESINLARFNIKNGYNIIYAHHLKILPVTAAKSKD